MTLEEGVDYAFSNPSPQQLYAAGKRFAMRYVGPGTAPKHLTTAERDALWAAGLSVVLLAEAAADSALGGYSMGLHHGELARAAADELGAPRDRPIYFAVDFDVTEAQWPLCVQYLRGAAAGVGAGQVGVYGSYNAMVWAVRDKVASWLFQTYAWSGGRWFAGNHVEQYRNGVPLAGGTVDLCRAKKSDIGQWAGDPIMSTRQEDFDALIWRVHGLVNNEPTVAGGPTKGEQNKLAAELAAIRKDLAELKVLVAKQQPGPIVTAISGKVTLTPVDDETP